MSDLKLFPNFGVILKQLLYTHYSTLRYDITLTLHQYGDTSVHIRLCQHMDYELVLIIE